MPYRVLAIDDSWTVRAVIAKTLKLAGAEVSRFAQAERGEEALRLLRQEPFDLVFCDLNMPGMTGFELVDALHRDGLLERVAVVIVSSLGQSPAIEELLAKGVKGYLRKPIRPEELLGLVNHLMGVTDGSKP